MAKDPYTTLPAGQVLFREGESGAAMYILESGCVEIRRAGVLLASLEAGDLCGEAAVLDDQPHVATATAKTDARLLRVERASVADLLRANADIAVRILRLLAARQQRAEQRFVETQTELAALKAASAAARAPAASVPADTPASPRPASAAAPARAAEASPPAQPPAPVVSPADAAAEAEAASASSSRLSFRHVASGERFALAPDQVEFLVGRPDPAAGTTPDINLGPLDVGRSLSRRHAKVLRRGEVLVLREEAATANGTFVNGQRLVTGVDSPLQAGDRVRFGAVELDVVAD